MQLTSTIPPPAPWNAEPQDEDQGGTGSGSSKGGRNGNEEPLPEEG